MQMIYVLFFVLSLRLSQTTFWEEIASQLAQITNIGNKYKRYPLANSAFLSTLVSIMLICYRNIKKTQNVRVSLNLGNISLYHRET